MGFELQSKVSRANETECYLSVFLTDTNNRKSNIFKQRLTNGPYEKMLLVKRIIDKNKNSYEIDVGKS